MKKVRVLHHPKTLTPKMRRFLDQLIVRFGDSHTNVKRSALKQAARELLGTLAAPRWITRNMTVRKTRGMYDLSVLAKLPVVDDDAPQQVPVVQPPASKAPKKDNKPSPKETQTEENKADLSAAHESIVNGGVSGGE